MPAGSTIKIFPGGKLIILSNGKIHNSCNGTWGGIELVKEGKQIGSLSIMEGGLIENTPQPLRKQP
jgi:hypothetical protein